METTLASVYRTQFIKAKPALQDFLLNQFQVYVKGIGEAFSLSEAQIANLENEAALVLLSISDPYELPLRIASSCEIDASIGEEIAMELYEVVISKFLAMLPTPVEVAAMSVGEAAPAIPSSPQQSEISVEVARASSLPPIPPLSAQRTMQADTNQAKGTASSRPQSVPRYSKPLTDLPKYGENPPQGM